MNRRSFFTSLGAIVAAAAAPSIFLPKFEPVRWKPPLIFKRAVVNPAYETARYEFFYIDEPMLVDRLIFNPKEFTGRWRFLMPPRGNELTPDGKLVPVPPYILV